MVSMTSAQLRSLETTERVASCFSLVGTTLIFITFISSPNFRKPINRLVFYASWGNILSNIGTLMSESPVRQGANSHLCQFQAFLIQMFVPADAFWNLAMAINVYLTLFKKYNAHQLKALEWRYHLMCYGSTFVIAFTFLFVETESRGKMYGPAVLWCWVSAKWKFMRIAVCYGPAWICIIVSFGIYLAAGREIFAKRHQLRAFAVNNEQELPSPLPCLSPDHIKVTTTHSLASVPCYPAVQPFPSAGTALTTGVHDFPSSKSSSDDSSSCVGNHVKIAAPSEKSYSVNITARPVLAHLSSSSFSTASNNQHHIKSFQRQRAAVEANRAAFGYTKVAALFFVSLLVTWVPSSVNRVYSVVYPERLNVSLAYVAGIVLSLMGFWNSVIYFVTSWRAVRCAWISSRWGRCEVDEIDVGAFAGSVKGEERISRVGRPSWVAAAGDADRESLEVLAAENERDRSRDGDSV